MHVKLNPLHIDYSKLFLEFDVILVEPPPHVTFEQLQSMDLKKISASYDQDLLLQESTSAENSVPNFQNFNTLEEDKKTRSFVFLWCNDSSKLKIARETIRKWGFRYSEEIIWCKQDLKNINSPFQTNSQLNKNSVKNTTRPYGKLFNESKEYCLVGISGNVKRDNDTDFVHSNCDTDLIIFDPNSCDNFPCPYGKPNEIFDIIERFCLGKRRLNLFARQDTIRNGWLSIGEEIVDTKFDYGDYLKNFVDTNLVATNLEIERLRPKSPNGRDNQTYEELQCKINQSNYIHKRNMYNLRKKKMNYEESLRVLF